MKLETLEQYYVKELRDLYDAEKQLLRALPRMAKAASHEQLKDAFEAHAEQTQEHVGRLEKILKKHDDVRGRRCKAMMGLIEEGREMMSENPLPDIMDVGLITTAQKVEHYEIAGYGCTTAYAKLLGFRDEAALLHKTLTEEKETDEKLTRLAESVVNVEAKDTKDDAEEASYDQRSARTRTARGRGGQKAMASRG